MRHSDSIKALAPALLNAQKAMGAATKNEKNPFFNSSYADLTAVISAIKGPLHDNGISYHQGVDVVDDKPVVETMLLHESGEWISSETPVYCAKPNDPQAFGSGVTYSKRYALQAILGLPTEDDDGNAGSGKTSQPAQPKPSLKEIEFANEVATKVAGILHKNGIESEVDGKKVNQCIYGLKKKYVSDMKLVDKTAEYIVNNDEALKFVRTK